MEKETPEKKNLEEEVSDLKARVASLEKDMEDVRKILNYVDATEKNQIQLNDVVHQKLEALRKAVGISWQGPQIGSA